jgi:tetratricopeptide (TPR) repeat protein
VAFLGRIFDQADPRREDAIAVFAEYAKRHPKNYLGAFLLGKANQSEADLRRAIELNPRFWEAHFELGCVLQAKRDYASAANSFREAINLAPDKSTPHYRLAQVFDRTGQHERAAKERQVHDRLAAEEKAELDRRQAATKHMDLKVKP